MVRPVLVFLRWKLEFQGWSRPYWIWLAISLWPVAYFVPKYLFTHSLRPPVGTYVTILGVLIAAVTFRKEPPVQEKAAWVILFTLITYAEIKNLYVTDQEQAERFDSISSSLATTQNGLATTLKGFETVTDRLKGISNDISYLIHHSDIEFQRVENGEISPNTRLPAPMPLVAGKAYHINTWLLNPGPEGNTLDGVLVKTYLARPDDEASQREVFTEFEHDWRQLKRPKTGVYEGPGQASFNSSTVAPISEAELREINEGKRTVYLIIRAAFLDRSGHWYSDYCFANQVGQTTFVGGVSHTCDTKYNRHHYPGR